MTFKLKCISVFLIASIYIYNCTNQKKTSNLLMEIRGLTMGTTFMVKIVKPEELKSFSPQTSKKEIRKDINNILQTINQKMSAFDQNSEISRFNRYRGTDWFRVSEDTAQVISESLKISEKSQGAFDITVGPLIDLWGFGPSQKMRKIPEIKQIELSLKKMGFKKISVKKSPPAIRKEIPELECNLSAIAKGFGVDKIAEYLDEKGFLNFLVEIGGEVKTRGLNPDRKFWRLGIATPDETFSLQKVIQLKDNAMATSGDYRNYFEENGIRYSHTIDPTAGKPITHKLASVTVIHSSCMKADALATAISVLGPDKGFELALKENLAVFLLIRKENLFIEKMTPQFEEIFN